MCAIVIKTFRGKNSLPEGLHLFILTKPYVPFTPLDRTPLKPRFRYELYYRMRNSENVG